MLNKLEHASIEEVVGEITVYNFKVKDNHNYFAIGESQDASFAGILVHNADYDKEYVVLQGSAFKSLDKSLRTGRDVIQSIDELIKITQNNTIAKL
jgi:hypothetical protein